LSQDKRITVQQCEKEIAKIDSEISVQNLVFNTAVQLGWQNDALHATGRIEQLKNAKTGWEKLKERFK